jgi:hypothetical protein
MKYGRSHQSFCANLLEPLEPRRLMSVYFVDAQNGSDANSGRSPKAAWQSLAAVNAHPFRRGDHLLFTGIFVNQTLLLGPTDNGVSVSTYLPTRNAIRTNVPNAAVFSGEQGDGIVIATSNITVQDIALIADPSVVASGNYNYGIYLHNNTGDELTHETINHVSATGFSYSGLCMQGWNTSAGNSAGFSNVLIENSSFYGNQVSGIFTGAGDDTGNEFQPAFPATLYVNSNLTIKNCLAYGNAGFNSSLKATPDGVNINQGNFTAGGIFVSSVNDAVVENCTVYDNCFDSLGSVGTWTFDSTRVNFQNDESYDNKTAGDGDGDGFDFDHGTTDSIMQNDFSHGNAGFGFFIVNYGGTSNNIGDTIRYCVSDDDGGSGICLLSSGQPLLHENVYNNTVLSNTEPAISVLGDSNASQASVNVLNNIFLTTATGPAAALSAAGPQIEFDRNDYWIADAPGSFDVSVAGTVYTSPDSFAAAAGVETYHGSNLALVEDPKLGNETVADLSKANEAQLALLRTSPLLKQGLNLATKAWAGSSPFDLDAPFNLAGKAWGGVGTRNAFGKPINRVSVGAG